MRLAGDRIVVVDQGGGPTGVVRAVDLAQAEAVAEHLAKGRQVAVTGRLEYRQWEGNDGSPHSKHEIIANQHNTKPECLPRSLHSVTRGFMDSRYRNSLAKQDLAPPGGPIDMTIEAKPIDYTFKKGHMIGLNISTEITEWNLPKPYPCSAPGCETIQIDWSKGQTKLVLPVVGAGVDPGPVELVEAPIVFLTVTRPELFGLEGDAGLAARHVLAMSVY